MLTEIPPWQSPVDIDSPWQRLYWTLPVALSICAIAFTWFAYSMERPSKRVSDPTPINAELVELPAPAQAESHPPVPAKKTVTQAAAQPVKQPERFAPAPSASAAPPAPPPAAPVEAPQAANSPPAPRETHGAKALIQPIPVIPDDLRQEAMSESAIARFEIAVDGTVTVALIKPTQNPRLNRLLLDTLRNWKFFPAMKDGKPVASVEEKVIRVSVK
jgi:protein TonB